MFIDILLFRRMLIPYLIQILFITGAIGAVTVGVLAIRANTVAQGVLIVIFGPILVRILCEYFIVLFKINENLVDINDKLGRKSL